MTWLQDEISLNPSFTENLQSLFELAFNDYLYPEVVLLYLETVAKSDIPEDLFK